MHRSALQLKKLKHLLAWHALSKTKEHVGMKLKILTVFIK